MKPRMFRYWLGFSARGTGNRGWVLKSRRLAALGLAGWLLVVGGGCTSRWGGGRVVARVGQRVVTEREWAEALVYSRGASELIGMVDELLIHQEAARLGIKVSPEQLRAKVTEIASYIGSRQALEDRLKELGMSMDEFNRRAETQALLDALVRQSIRITDEEVLRYYTTHQKQFRHGPRARARMMLFQSRANAEAVMTALRAGGDFAGLAKALSEDPATAGEGGDMGWFEAEDYAAPISKMAFSLKPGQVSPIFRGPDGWYIIKLEAKQPAGIEPLEKVAGRIRARLVQERVLTERSAWLKQRRKQARIAIDDARLAGAVQAQLETAPPAPALPGLMTLDQLMLSPTTPPQGKSGGAVAPPAPSQ